MTLDMASKGLKIEIVSIPDPLIRAQAIRLGIYEGAKLTCAEKLPKGPVILQNRLQEIAVGRGLAQQIKVKAV